MSDRVQNRKRAIAVCLVERNPLAARYLLGILQQDPNIKVLSEEDVLSGPGRRAMEVIFVIDVDTLSDPVASYLTVLRSRFPDARTLLVGEEPSADELRRLPFLGIQGFVSYYHLEDQLCLALRAISEGDAWFAPQVLSDFLDYSRAFRPVKASDGRREEVLTPREKTIVGLLKRRLGNKEIAAALKISESTVKFHLSNIFKKLGVRDRNSAGASATSRRCF